MKVYSSLINIAADTINFLYHDTIYCFNIFKLIYLNNESQFPNEAIKHLT